MSDRVIAALAADLARRVLPPYSLQPIQDGFEIGISREQTYLTVAEYRSSLYVKLEGDCLVARSASQRGNMAFPLACPDILDQLDSHILRIGITLIRRRDKSK